MNDLNVTKSSKYGIGDSKVTCKVLSSITFIPTSFSETFLALYFSPFFITNNMLALLPAVSGFNPRIHPALKSFAVTGSPLLHLTPSLR